LAPIVTAEVCIKYTEAFTKASLRDSNESSSNVLMLITPQVLGANVHLVYCSAEVKLRSSSKYMVVYTVYVRGQWETETRERGTMR
jgi:hypothetical protein